MLERRCERRSEEERMVAGTMDLVKEEEEKKG